MIQGVAYYPELIDPTEWEQDLNLMKEYGFDAVRIAEFAWSQMEPREGEYVWDWLDQFWELCHRLEMKIVLCTPTAAVPSWMLRDYPEVLAVLRDGRRLTYGERRNICINSPIFRYFCEKIIRAMANRYGQKPELIGWQIDNELIGPEGYPFECHCRECEWRFRQWLKERYSSIQELNKAWFLGFWSLEYSNWGQVGTPCCENRVPLGHYLEFLRFHQSTHEEFIRFQYHILRPLTHSQAFVSHNSTGIFDRSIDHIQFARELDLAGWDAYRGAASGGHPDREPFTSLAHELFRSALHRPFVVFETNTDWMQTPAYLAQMKAYGANGIFFWLWRRHRGNMEQGSEALCGYNGQPYRDRLQMIQNTFLRLRNLPNPSTGYSKVAFWFDADCVRMDYRRKQRPIPYLDRLIKTYRVLWELGIRVDVVRPGDNLSPYSILIASAPHLMSRETGQQWTQFVQKGGYLFVTSPLARYDYYGVFYRKWGEPILSLIGGSFSDDVGKIPDTQTVSLLPEGVPMQVSGTIDCLETFSNSIIPWAVFPNLHTNPIPACWEHPYGNGKTLICTVTDTNLIRWALKRWFHTHQIPTRSSPSPSCLVVPDLGDSSIQWFINLGNEPVTLANGEIVPPQDFLWIKGSSLCTG